MAKKTNKNTRAEDYRRILEIRKSGLRLEDCRVLAFRFEVETNIATFHYRLMLDERHPKYHIFDHIDRTAQVVIPDDDAIEAVICEIAEGAGGKKITPNLN